MESFVFFCTKSETDAANPYMIAVFVIFILMLIIFFACTYLRLRKLMRFKITEDQLTKEETPENPFNRKADQ